MRPFERATIDLTSVRATVHDLRKLGVDADIVRRIARDMKNEELWLNDKYQVAVRRFFNTAVGHNMAHLSIRRLDREPVRDWRELQQIKNELAGPECEGVELYPAESRLVDAANQFHLWVILVPAVRWPVGFQGRLVSEDRVGNSKNRPFDKQEGPR